MPSSTSNSRKPAKADIALLLALVAIFCCSVEAIAGYFFVRVSRIEKRRETEYHSALAIRSAKQRGRASVLVVGNSLLLHGVDFPSLQRNVGSDFELQRAVFENTGYLDWHYGLRRLFKSGARPDVVVLVLNPKQLVSNWTAGDYSAQMLVDGEDLLPFAKDLRADRNRLSVLALDNLSYFFGTRAETRSWILGKLMPDLPSLTHHFHVPSSVPDNNGIAEISGERLKQTRQLCEEYGAMFVFAIPPAIDDSGENIVVRAAQVQSIPVLIPMPPGSLPRSDYSDLIHLNAQGAAEFTPALAADLRAVIVTPRQQASTATAAQPALGGQDVTSSSTKTRSARPNEPLSAKTPLGQLR
jgi:hypothetical protein